MKKDWTVYARYILDAVDPLTIHAIIQEHLPKLQQCMQTLLQDERVRSGQ